MLILKLNFNIVPSKFPILISILTANIKPLKLQQIYIKPKRKRPGRTWSFLRNFSNTIDRVKNSRVNDNLQIHATRCVHDKRFDIKMANFNEETILKWNTDYEPTLLKHYWNRRAAFNNERNFANAQHSQRSRFTEQGSKKLQSRLRWVRWAQKRR